MRSVTPEYKVAMAKSFRNQSFVKITLGAFAVGADTDASFAPSSAQPESNVSILSSDYKYNQSYGTFEEDFLRVDGSQFIRPTATNAIYYKSGMVSTELSGEDCYFVTQPTMTIDFSETHNIVGYTMFFDTIQNDYPVEFMIEGFKDNVSTVVHNVTDNNSSKFERVLQTADVNKLVITFTKMNKPNRRLRFTRIMFGIGYMFDNNTLTGVTQSATVHPLSLELPKYTLDFTVINENYEYDVDNVNSLTYFLEAEQEVAIQYGYMVDKDTQKVEWFPAGNFTLKDWSTSKNRLEATFKCDNILDNYNEVYYKGVFGNISLYDLAEDVLLDMGYAKYRLDPFLKTVYTTNPLPQIPHKQCLQLIANMGKCVLTKSDDDYIEITSNFVPEYTLSTADAEVYSNLNNVKNLDIVLEDYASFDNKVFKVDGSQFLFTDAPPYKSVGFVSTELSGSDSVYANQPKLTVEFESIYSTYGMQLLFGENFPAKINIKGYNETVLKYNFDVPVTGKLFTFNKLMSEITKIEVSWVKSTLPYQRARLDKVLGFGRETDFTLGYNAILGFPSGTMLPVLRYVSVKNYAFSTSSALENIYDQDVLITGTDTIRIDYNDAATNQTVVVTGGTLVSAEHYAYCSILTITGSGIVHITINGNIRRSVTSDVIISRNPKGEVVEVDNPLVSSHIYAQSLGEWVADYASQRQEYNIDYRGNPEIESGDTIYLETRTAGDIKVKVLSHEISFNGGLSGSMKARGNIV